MVRGPAVIVAGVLMLAGAFLQAQTDLVSDRARKIHGAALVLDTHVDIPNLLIPGWNFTDEHQKDQVDLPRIRKGGLDALFMSIYMPGTVTGSKAVGDAVELIAAVRRLVDDHPVDLVLCMTAEDVRRAHTQRKVAILMGMEGGHMINNSLAILRTYSSLGVRYLTLTHSVNTDWADSSGDQPKHNGLTEFGRQVVGELNRLGVMVDISHVSDKTFWDALEVSRAPMLASHSSVRAIAPHARNMTDDMIRALAAKGGVIQINYNTTFIDSVVTAHMAKREPRQKELELQFPGKANEARVDQVLTAEFGPRPPADWEKILDHIDHAVKLAGPDHVGLGSDFDGATMPTGMEDVSRLPKITEGLLRRGYRASDVRKILGENTLRLMADVERVSKQLQKEGDKSR
jgi:membrane dipeptidase